MRISDVPLAVVVSLPFGVLVGTAFAALLHLLGVHQTGGPSIASLAAIVICIRFFRDRVANPSKELKVAAAIAWVLVALIVWAARTHLIDVS